MLEIGGVGCVLLQDDKVSLGEELCSRSILSFDVISTQERMTYVVEFAVSSTATNVIVCFVASKLGRLEGSQQVLRMNDQSLSSDLSETERSQKSSLYGTLKSE